MEQRESLKDKVYNAVLDGIVKGEYKGEQILNETQLIEKFQVSKSPVREALIALCNEDILKNIPRYGYQVVSFTLTDIHNILEYRAILESYILKNTYPQITTTHLEHLRRLTTSAHEDNCDIWEHWEANMKFHLMLCSFCENEYIYKQIEKSLNILKRAYAQFYWSQWNSVSTPNDLKNHSLILDAIEAKNMDDALRYLQKDLQDFCVF